MYCIRLVGKLEITLSMKLQFTQKITHVSCAHKLIFNVICELAFGSLREAILCHILSYHHFRVKPID